MKKFTEAVRMCRQRYPVLWAHHGCANRRKVVAYWLFDMYIPDPPAPGQLSLWSV